MTTKATMLHTVKTGVTKPTSIADRNRFVPADTFSSAPEADLRSMCLHACIKRCLVSGARANIARRWREMNCMMMIDNEQHIRPVLAQLHWLPVKYRVHFKLAVITFNAFTTQQPSYLAELLSVHEPRRDLRSGNYQRRHVPGNKLKFTVKFSHASPTIYTVNHKKVAVHL